MKLFVDFFLLFQRNRKTKSLHGRNEAIMHTTDEHGQQILFVKYMHLKRNSYFVFNSKLYEIFRQKQISKNTL